MENGLKTADPSDGTGYTGWAGTRKIAARPVDWTIGNLRIKMIASEFTN